jgi:hypothetical protein
VKNPRPKPPNEQPEPDLENNQDATEPRAQTEAAELKTIDSL